jgi:CheY-like chemotaxis protein
MPKLYYVDDQSDYRTNLSHIVADAIADTNITPDIKYYEEVERFMMDITTADPSDAFLLDINMPVPRRLKTQRVWPTGHLGEDQFCGIALAKWLLVKASARKEQIAFITHWDNLKGEHETAAIELGIDEYFTKHDPKPLQGWIRGRFL